MPQVNLHPEAAAEVEASYRWYEGQSSGLGDEFLREVEAGMAAIGDCPDRWPVFGGQTKRYLLHRFPFGLVYCLKGEAVIVLAVMHLRRRPGYWRRRRPTW